MVRYGTGTVPYGTIRYYTVRYAAYGTVLNLYLYSSTGTAHNNQDSPGGPHYQQKIDIALTPQSRNTWL
jgi:hypothetical protein